MYELFKWKDLWKNPSADDLAQRELEDAERHLLHAYSSQEATNALVSYNENRVTRLKERLGKKEEATVYVIGADKAPLMKQTKGSK